ncbi:hypothetical protein BDV95DRAFT_22298 [Massariosphaeria phaeospora]|uniref:Uncharacterized protein n=1 Tax=Massariosphaeria phaeospora TaxID=100035 RepID=A0A7C8ME97_9PLEO|nr:hypothetical protein BDV95DRAFT_22298 [Massariosphaeria phaeospora]
MHVRKTTKQARKKRAQPSESRILRQALGYRNHRARHGQATSTNNKARDKEKGLAQHADRQTGKLRKCFRPTPSLQDRQTDNRPMGICKISPSCALCIRGMSVGVAPSPYLDAVCGAIPPLPTRPPQNAYRQSSQRSRSARQERCEGKNCPMQCLQQTRVVHIANTPDPDAERTIPFGGE